MSLPSQRRSFGPRVSPKSKRGPAGPKLVGGVVLLAVMGWRVLLDCCSRARVLAWKSRGWAGG